MNRGGKVFYGWYIIGACFIIAFIVFGISVNTLTVYVKPIEAEMGWARREISLGMTLAAFAMGISAPFIGRLIDRAGARVVMAAGATVIAVSTLLLSRAHSLPYFYTLYIIAGIGQAAATLIPISLVVSNWFKAKRGMALGITMTGTGLGAMVMVPVCSFIVDHWGWRISYFAMGCIIFLIAVPINLIFIRTQPSDMGLLPDGGIVEENAPLIIDGLTVSQALKTSGFWLIGVMMLIFGLVAMGIGFHLMAYLTDIGHTTSTAARIIAVISGMTVVGKIGIGFIADRWGIRQALVLACAMILAGIFLLMGSKAFMIACIFAVVYGFAIGSPLLINPGLTAECMGLANFGAIFGMLSLLNTAGAAVGAFLTGAVYDNAKSYVPAFLFFVVVIAIAGVCGVMARKSASYAALEKRDSAK